MKVIYTTSPNTTMTASEYADRLAEYLVGKLQSKDK